MGHARDNDLLLDDCDSEYHSELILVEGGYRIQSIDDSVPTLVNAEPCQDRLLRAGDEIQISTTVIQYRADNDGGGIEEIRLPVDALAAPGDGESSALTGAAFTLLYNVGRKVLSASSLEDLNELALSLVFDCAKAERAALLLHDPQTDQFVPRLQRARDGRPLPASELTVPSSIVQAATTQRVGIITSDALADDRFKERESVRVGDVRSALCVPLWDEGEMLGVIYLDSQIQSYAFTRDDLMLLNAVANLIAIRLRQEELNEALAEEQMMRSNLERYHSPAVVDAMLAHTRSGATAEFGLEEREISILFADITGFTPLAESLPPSAVAELLNAYYALTTRAIYDQGGSVIDYLGDGVLAVFGAPVSRDDHADRAVDAGLELLRALDGQEVVARVAINSGTVMVGNVGTQFQHKFTVVGDAVNVAARLEGLAEPGFVTIGEDTERLLHKQYPTEDLGELKLRGRAKPTRGYLIRP